MKTLTSVMCLAAIARHHGLAIAAEQIVHENSLDSQEPSLTQLGRIAENIRLKSSCQSLNWDELLLLEQSPLGVEVEEE